MVGKRTPTLRFVEATRIAQRRLLLAAAALDSPLGHVPLATLEHQQNVVIVVTHEATGGFDNG